MKKFIVPALFIIEIVAIWSRGPITQDLAYHHFADDRMFLGIQNFFDVLSNIPFFIVGGWGCYRVLQNYSRRPQALCWLVLFVGVILVAPGSMYYHLNPNNQTLVWDRLPMTIGFMGLTVALFNLYFPNRFENFFLILALLIGFGSIAYWVTFDDLRPYAIVQLTPLFIIPALMILYPNSKVQKRYLLGAFIFYVGAKITEYYDAPLYKSVGISGHTIKHLLAAVAVGCFVGLISNDEASV